MSFTQKTIGMGVAAAISTFAFASAALAGDITVLDPYARASGMSAKAGAAFMLIRNAGKTDDRLVAVASGIARKTELHTHKIDENGVARMVEVEEGIVIPAGGTHALARGGDHVMFMGLSEGFEQGKILSITLTFENAGDIVVDVPVDLDRKPNKP